MSFNSTLQQGDLISRRLTLLQRLHIDGWLLLILLIIGSLSLFILYSGSSKSLDMVGKQASSFGVGLIIMFGVAQIEPRFVARWSWLGYLVGLLLLVAVDVIGHNAMGATRWINLGIMRFQPAELMKIAMPCILAWYVAKYSLPPTLKHLAISAVALILPFILIARQPDLGTALLVLASGVFVLFLGGLRWAWIGGVLAAAVPVAWGLWEFYMHDYQKRRVLTLFNPSLDPLGAGWNINQSQTAIGSGGIYGKGWLAGTQSHLDFLPESHTDFIFAVLSEEFGMVGVGILLVLYTLLIMRGLIIAAQAQSLFGKLLAGSLTLTFFVYVFVNIGMVSGILPIVGIPLPFVSYGGTSIVTLMAGFGILMSIHTHRKWIVPT